MKKVLFFALMIFGCMNAFAQTTEELISKLSNAKEDADKVNLLCRIADLQRAGKEYEKAYLYASMAIETSKKLSDRSSEAYACENMGHILFDRKDFGGATSYFLQSLVLYELLSNKKKIGLQHVNIGDVYKAWKAFQKAKEHYSEALKIFNDGKEIPYQLRALKGFADCSFILQDLPTAEQNYAKILQISRANNNNNEASSALQDLSLCSKEKSDFETALKYSLERYQMLGTSKNGSLEHALVANNIGFLYKQSKNNAKAVEFFRTALDMLAKINAEKRGADAVVLDNMGVVQVNLGDFKKAKSYFKDALTVHEKNNDKEGIASSYNYLAACDYVANQNDLALEEVETAIEMGIQNKTYEQLAESYKIQSEIFSAMGDFKRSQEAYKKYQDLKEQIETQKQKEAEAAQAAIIAAEKKENEFKLLMADQEKKELELKQLQLETEKKQGEIQLQQQQLALLTRDKELQNTQIYNQKLEKERALQTLEITEGRLKEEQRQRQIDDLEKEKELQASTIKQKELEQKEKQKALELLESDKKLKDQMLSEQERIQKYNYYFYGLILFVFIAVGFAFYQKQKANRVLAKQNVEIREQQEQIRVKNEELLASEEELRQNNEELMATQEIMRSQKELLEAVNTEIAQINTNLFDSIRYAERIQFAVLPAMNIFQKAFPDTMIFFLPKDIVSGDFYWTATVNNMTFCAVVDCTGHGVPGAFMSMIGSTLLNEIVNQKAVYQPAAILKNLNKAIVKALKQDEKENRDGMDVCLMRTEKSPDNDAHTLITFCGAKRPLYVINDENFVELKGDRKSIGGSQNEETAFQDQVITVPPNTVLYLTTDGYADQNNEKREKVGSKAVKELIKEIFKKPFNEQHKAFEAFLNEHKQYEKQRDDITILAIRI